MLASSLLHASSFSHPISSKVVNIPFYGWLLLAYSGYIRGKLRLSLPYNMKYKQTHKCGAAVIFIASILELGAGCAGHKKFLGTSLWPCFFLFPHSRGFKKVISAFLLLGICIELVFHRIEGKRRRIWKVNIFQSQPDATRWAKKQKMVFFYSLWKKENGSATRFRPSSTLPNDKSPNH